MASLLDAQFGFGVESTYGTRVAPTRFLPFVSENIGLQIDYIKSASYRTGRRTDVVRRPGAQRVVGDLTMELAPQGFGLFQKCMLGSSVDSGTGPYGHLSGPASLSGRSMSIQIGRGDSGGTLRPFDYSGCMVTKWEINAEVGKLAMLKSSFYGIAEDTSQTLATPTYPTGLAPFSFIDGSLTIAGAATPVKSIALTGDNGLLVDRQRIQASNPGQSLQPRESQVRAYGGTVVADFTDLTAYNRFVNQTQATLVTTFANGASAILVVTSSVEFDGATPSASGMGNETDQPLPFTCISATSDATVIQFALTNSDATP